MNIYWCKNCVMPSTRPNILIYDDGICNACKFHKNVKLKVDWKKRKNEFQELVKAIKAKNKNNYDCVIPVSGGKDSIWQVNKCLEHNLKPLAVTWKAPSRTILGEKNLKALINLGVDHIDWQVNPKVEKKLLKECFFKYGSTAIPMHNAIHSIPVKIAHSFGIKYIFWGENSAEEYGYIDKTNIGKKMKDAWIKSYGNIFDSKKNPIKNNCKEFLSYNYFKKKNTISKIFLGYYFSWDPIASYKIAKKHGFKKNLSGSRIGFYDFADVDDDFISIHHWLKWYKFGFTRDFDNLSLEIRNKRITRLKAIKIISKKKIKPPLKDIQKFCKFIEISEKNFFEIAEKFRNKKIWYRKNKKWYLKNFILDKVIW